MCTTVPSNILFSSGQMVFVIDMIYYQNASVDWQVIKEKHRVQAIGNNCKENKTCITHEYKVGDLLIVKKSCEGDKKSKLSTATKGPNKILTYTNRNVRLCRETITNECILVDCALNIRKIKTMLRNKGILLHHKSL